MGELVSVKLSFVVTHLVNIEAVKSSEIMNLPDQMNVDSSNEKQSPRISSQQVDDIDYSSRRQSIAVSHRRCFRGIKFDGLSEFFGFPHGTWNKTKDVVLQGKKWRR